MVVQRSTRAETPLEFYDFFFEAFKEMSRANLLEAMATAPDHALIVGEDDVNNEARPEDQPNENGHPPSTQWVRKD